MLVLKCDVSASVILTTAEGVRIEVKVTGTEPGAAYLAFQAPDSVNIVRDEVSRDPHRRRET